MEQTKSEAIVAALKRKPLETRMLARIVGSSPQEVQRLCERLAAGGVLADDLPDPRDRRITEELEKNGALPTSELAAKIGMEPRQVYQRCRRLQERVGLLSSHSEPGTRQLYFFPATGKVLTRGNRDDIAALRQLGRSIARKHGVKRGQKLSKPVKDEMKRAYRGKLKQLRAKASRSERQKLEALEGELMAKLGGTFLSDVMTLVGLRPFVSRVRVWEEIPGDPNVPPRVWRVA